jgi:AcrR family transcriptional regulator
MPGRGRPKTFERETALTAAMLMFWQCGYEETGIDDLVRTMGISTSSLYSTFGDKEALFLAALDLYQSTRGSYTKTALEGSSLARDSFRSLFDIAAFELTRRDQPKGCMLALSMPTCSPNLEPLRGKINRKRALSLTGFRDRLKAAKDSGELPASVDIEILAEFLMTTLQGMSLRARSGVSREELLKVGRFALQIWPKAI